MEGRNVLLNEMNIKDVQKDLNTAIYMLHFVNKELFSQIEIQNVSFSLKVMLDSSEKMMKGKK